MSFTVKSKNTSTLHWTTSVFVLSMQLLITAKHSHNQINTTKNTENTSKHTTTQTPQTVRAAENTDEKTFLQKQCLQKQQELVFTAYKKSFIHIFYIFFYWTITCLTEKCYSLIKTPQCSCDFFGFVCIKFLPVLLGEIFVRLDGNVWQTTVSEFLYRCSVGRRSELRLIRTQTSLALRYSCLKDVHTKDDNDIVLKLF